MRDWFEQKDEFGIGHKNWTALRAIQSKLIVQYRPLITRLHRRFSTGPMGDTLDELDSLVRRVLSVLRTTLESEHASKGDQQEILNSIGRIEHLLKVVARHEKQDTDFAKGLQGVEQNLGVSLKELTISRGLAAKGFRGAGQTPRGSGMRQVKNTLKRGYSDVLAAASSVAGPFAPYLHAGLKGLSSGIGGAFGGSEGKDFRGDQSLRANHPREQSGESQDFVASMRQFYNTDAYKARWTRELLDVLKSKVSATETTQKKGILDTIKDIGLAGSALQLLPKPIQEVMKSLGGFGTALIKYATIVGGFLWSAKEVYDLWKLLKEDQQGRAAANKTAFAVEDVIPKADEAIYNRGPSQTARELGYTNSRELARAHAERKKRAEYQHSLAEQSTVNKLVNALSPLDKLPSVLGVSFPSIRKRFLKPEPKLQPVLERDIVDEERQLTTHRYQRGTMPAHWQQSNPETWNKVVTKLEEINKTLKEGQKKAVVPVSAGIGPRNTYDSSDTLTDRFLHSVISLGER